MTSQNFLELIGLKSNADISAAGTAFTEKIRDYIRFVEENASLDNAPKEEAEVTVLYKSFFPYSVNWAEEERKKHSDSENHPEALKLKDKGQAAVNDLQANIIEFAICYMRIHRCIGLINAKILQTPEPEDKDAQWTGDTGVVLGKYRKQRAELIATNKKLIEAHTLLENINPKRADVEKAAIDLYGEDLGHKALGTYRSGLRTRDFTKARTGLKKALDQKKKFALDKSKTKKAEDTMKTSGEAYIAFLEKNHEILTGAGEKLYLKPSEVNIVIDTNKKEIAKREDFIKKYFRPFLNHQIKSLKYLRTKLLVIGSLESLMTFYIRMMRGIAQPITDIKAVRLYESEVIEHVMYLLTGQFQEVKNIERRIEEILQEFAVSVHDYSEVN